MKVSIIIPAYNEEKSIAAAIAAALAQDYESFEVIVVNNASTDRTKEVAAGYPVIVVDEMRKGLLHARECGRQHATGEIIANMDADCLPEKDWLARGVVHFADPKIIAVSGPYEYYDLNWLPRKFFLWTFQYMSRFMNMLMQLPLIKYGGVLVGGNDFIRASTLEKVHGYDTTIEFYGEDTNTAKRISADGRIYFDPQLIMKTSGRRFLHDGFMNVSWKYFTTFFMARK